MGTIEVIGKWDLEKNNWQKITKESEKGRAFAFVDYQKINNNEQELKYDYIILAQGSRVENHSKDFITVKEKEVGINKIINYFQNSNKNIIIKLFLMDADAPINEDAKLFAQYIDNLSLNPNTNSINIIGISKCGAMAFNIPKYFKSLTSFNKTNIYTVATPFDGTKMAFPLIFYPEIKKLIISKLGDNKISNLVYNELITFYEKISSNSHMDYDIAMLGGIPPEKIHLYDESFIKNIFSTSNIAAIAKLQSYKNIITGIDSKTLNEAIRTMNFTGIGLCILNDLFFEKKSDGMVMTESQKLVESQNIIEGLKSNILISSHHDVMSNHRVLKKLLGIVDDTLGEQQEIALYKKKKRN